MTGKEIVDRWYGEQELFKCAYYDLDGTDELISAIDAALAAERERCAQIVWEYLRMCVSDESARALMEEVRRVR